MRKLSIPSSVHEKLEGLTSLQRALFFLVTFLIVGSGFYFLKYKPETDRIRSLKGNIAQQEKRLSELKQASIQVEVLKKELAESEIEFAQLLSMLPDQKEIPGLLDSVSQLGAQVGLENILFQPQPEQPHEFYAAIPVRLDLLGSYHKLGTFFDKISKLNRILKVDNLSISRRSDSSLQVGCTIITYRFIEQAQTEKTNKKNAGKSKKK
jgi:type IV pilus assembly protein PilO